MSTALIIILSIVGGIILLVAILSAISPTKVNVERSIVIKKPRPEVYDSLRSLKHHSTWSPWGMRDPNMQEEYRGTDGEVGSVHYWNSQDKNVGEGEQEITKLTPNERVESELRFLRPFKTTNQAYLIMEDAEGGTKVRWGFHAVFKRPMNAMMMFMNMDKAIGKDFEEGLDNMKRNFEAGQA